MRTFALVGHPLTHSFSASYFSDKFLREGIDASYINLDLSDLTSIKEIIRKHQITGFNVTIPFKEIIIPYLDVLSPSAEQIGAVNCVQIKGKELFGHNTDVIGFKRSLQAHIANNRISKALVFGSGGSSKAVIHALNEIGITPTVVSRSGTLRYEQLKAHHIQEALLLVNTTPLGMFPKTEHCVDIPYDIIGPEHFAFDLIYNPAETLFLKRIRERGGKTKNGQEMLEIQAEECWTIWNS